MSDEIVWASFWAFAFFCLGFFTASVFWIVRGVA